MTNISIICTKCEKEIEVDKIIFKNLSIQIESQCKHVHSMKFVNHGGGSQNMELYYKGILCKCERTIIPYEEDIIEQCMYCTKHEEEVHYKDPHYINCKEYLVLITNIDLQKKEDERKEKRKMHDYKYYLELLNKYHPTLIAFTYQQWKAKKSFEWSDHATNIK